MTDEEFYKNKLLALCNNMLIVDKENIQHYLGDDIEPIIKIKDNRDKELVDLKRKRIIKEKTWYKTRDGGNRFVYAIFDDRFRKHHNEPVRTINIDGMVGTRCENGACFAHMENNFDLMRECTPEEVREIEDKLRGKNNE